jgi:hypothetical protein
VEDTRVLQELFLDRRVDAALVPTQALQVEAGATNSGADAPAAPRAAGPAAGSGDAAPVPTRRSVLEAFYRAADLRHAAEASVDDALAALQLLHTQPEAANAPAAFDELAYTEALRRALLPVEPVSEADLLTLANARIQAIAVALALRDPTLGTRLSAGDVLAVAGVEDGWIQLALALEAQP